MFSFLPYQQLENNAYELIDSVYDAHDESGKPLSEDRIAELGLIRMFLENPQNDISPEDQSEALTGWLLYIKKDLRAKGYSGVWSYVADPKWSTLYQGIDPAIGVGDENQLGQKIEMDEASERKALIAARNYLNKYDLLHMMQLKNMVTEIEANINKKEEVSSVDSEEEKIRKRVQLERDLLLKKYTTATINADISKYLPGDVTKSIKVREGWGVVNYLRSFYPANKKQEPSSQAIYLQRQIREFDKTKLKSTTTRIMEFDKNKFNENVKREPAAPFAFRNVEDPTYYMKNDDGKYDNASVEKFRENFREIEPILEAYDHHVEKNLPYLEMPKISEAWELGRNNPLAKEGVEWKKVTERNEKQSATWLPEHDARVELARKAQLEEAGKKYYSNARIDEASYINAHTALPAERPLVKRLYDEFVTHSIFATQVKKQLENSDNNTMLKKADTRVTHDCVVDEEVEISRPAFRK
ncbi:MAG: hypothetical protein JO149_08330 [Gammaproteobacteria bacterium]|nr:hypothetical protein [Gammaproteobacteria bacterium]